MKIIYEYNLLTNGMYGWFNRDTREAVTDPFLRAELDAAGRKAWPDYFKTAKEKYERELLELEKMTK